MEAGIRPVAIVARSEAKNTEHAAKAVLVTPEYKILHTYYVRTHGQPFETIRDILGKIASKTEIEHISVTGTGGKKLASIIPAVFVNEITAQAASTGALYPQVKTIIEISII